MAKEQSIDNALNRRQRVVIKIGTSSLIQAESGTLNLRSIAALGDAVRRLRDADNDVVVVSSGAVGVGAQKLGLETRPTVLAERQALAAVGQGHLMRFYEDVFTASGLTCAQVLLTLDNLADRDQYINAGNTFEELFALGVVPIVNENDTVAVEQLRFGDNDTLAAQVGTLIHADWVFLLTDVDCLYTANPNTDPDAKPIHVVPDISQLNVSTDGAGSNFGTGGMETKITAAGLATVAGARMVICQADPEIVPNVVLDGERVGTLFLPTPSPIQSVPKRWLLSAPSKGRVTLQASSVEALMASHAVEEGEPSPSVTAACVAAVSGEFDIGDAVTLVCSESGKELGRCMAEVTASQLQENLETSAALTEAGKDISTTDNGEVYRSANASKLEVNVSATEMILCSGENACILPSAPVSVASSGSSSVAALSEVGSDADEDATAGGVSADVAATSTLIALKAAETVNGAASAENLKRTSLVAAVRQ